MREKWDNGSRETVEDHGFIIVVARQTFGSLLPAIARIARMAGADDMG